MGAPQLFDMAAAGEAGRNYLVYEFRESRSVGFSPIIVNFFNNTETTDTIVFYFDETGVLESVGSSRGTPTTKRSVFTVLLPWAIHEVVK